MFRAEKSDGFSLIELLIVVAVIGIIAAILIPNLIDSVNKAKQRRTVADMRNVGTAWMSWLTDQVTASSAGAGKTWSSGNLEEITYVELLGYLYPSDDFFYMQEVPQIDGWGNPFFFAKGQDLNAPNVFVVCSGGQDGVLDVDCVSGPVSLGPFIASDYAQDIVWADGYFVRWPG